MKPVSTRTEIEKALPAQIPLLREELEGAVGAV